VRCAVLADQRHVLAADEAGALELWDLTSGGIAECFEEVPPHLPCGYGRMFGVLFLCQWLHVAGRDPWRTHGALWCLPDTGNAVSKGSTLFQIAFMPSFARLWYMMHHLWVLSRAFISG